MMSRRGLGSRQLHTQRTALVEVGAWTLGAVQLAYCERFKALSVVGLGPAP